MTLFHSNEEGFKCVDLTRWSNFKNLIANICSDCWFINLTSANFLNFHRFKDLWNLSEVWIHWAPFKSLNIWQASAPWSFARNPVVSCFLNGKIIQFANLPIKVGIKSDFIWTDEFWSVASSLPLHYRKFKAKTSSNVNVSRDVFIKSRSLTEHGSTGIHSCLQGRNFRVGSLPRSYYEESGNEII